MSLWWLPPNILRGIVPTATLWDGQIGFAFQAKTGGTVFTDFSAAANNVTANDVTLFDATAQLNDAFYFGENFSISGIFNKLLINVGTVMSGFTGSMVWEYYNGAWVTLPGVVDGTSFFTVSGSNYVSFTSPGDMGHVAVNAQDRYWVRVRISAFTAMTVKPLGTQIWLGRYPTVLTNITDGNESTVSGTGTVLLGASGTFGLIEIDLGVSKTVQISGKVGVWSSASNINVYCDAFSTSGQIPSAHTAIYSPFSTSSELAGPVLTKIMTGRYIVFRFQGGAAQTAYGRIYEIRAYEVGT